MNPTANCRKCREVFTPTENQSRKSDFLCKECKYKYESLYRTKRKEAGNPVPSGKTSPQRKAEYGRAYFLNEENRKRRNQLQRQYRQSEQLRVRHDARSAVGKAVKSGRLVKMNCEICSSPIVEAHHDDYSKPLQVRWLCIKHHREAHDAAKGGEK